MGLIFHFPVTGTLSYSRSDRGDSPPVQDVSLGELLAILSLPFWPVFRLAAKGADRILHRAYYRRAREDREMQEAYVARLRELSRAPVFDREAYYRAVRDFSDARDRIREQREREDLLCRNARARRGFAPFASARALKGRAERRKRRDSAWLDWAKALADWALRRVGAPPEPPLARPGRTLRKLCGGSLRPAPSPEALLAQYGKARGRGRVEEKIRLGSMLLDLEAAVDNGPVRNGEGVIVGRNPGLLGWLRENCRELAPHYAALQNCRRMAHAFRTRRCRTAGGWRTRSGFGTGWATRCPRSCCSLPRPPRRRGCPRPRRRLFPPRGKRPGDGFGTGAGRRPAPRPTRSGTDGRGAARGTDGRRDAKGRRKNRRNAASGCERRNDGRGVEKDV